MKFSLTILAFLLSICFLDAQFLIIPSDYIIKKPSKGYMKELSVQPSTNSLSSRKFREIDNHYIQLVSNEMNIWLTENFSDSKVYDSNDKTIDVEIKKLQSLIHRERSVYQMLKNRPLFGYGGRVPTEGDFTKEELQKFFKVYKTDFVIFTSIVSLYRDGLMKKYVAPEYLGHLVFYAWVLDTETGEIVEEVKIKGGETSIFIKGFNPSYSRVTDEYVIKKCKKLQRKLATKMNRLYE